MALALAVSDNLCYHNHDNGVNEAFEHHYASNEEL